MKFACEPFVYLDCSYSAKYWINFAISLLPRVIWDHFKGKLAIVCVDSSDGRRLTFEFCKNREIVILSERIVPNGPSSEIDPSVRYFVFVVLHEIAHAYCDHKAPNDLNEVQSSLQENEADNIAFDWYNEHLKLVNQPLFEEKELNSYMSLSVKKWERAIQFARDIL